jgi:hypothetical protein
VNVSSAFLALSMGFAFTLGLQGKNSPTRSLLRLLRLLILRIVGREVTGTVHEMIMGLDWSIGQSSLDPLIVVSLNLVFKLWASAAKYAELCRAVGAYAKPGSESENARVRVITAPRKSVPVSRRSNFVSLELIDVPRLDRNA